MVENSELNLVKEVDDLPQKNFWDALMGEVLVSRSEVNLIISKAEANLNLRAKRIKELSVDNSNIKDELESTYTENVEYAEKHNVLNKEIEDLNSKIKDLESTYALKSESYEDLLVSHEVLEKEYKQQIEKLSLEPEKQNNAYEEKIEKLEKRIVELSNDTGRSVSRDVVLAIRDSDEDSAVLSERYNLDKSLVTKIKRRRAYRDIV